MTETTASWDALTRHMAEAMRLAQVHGLLAWDQQVNLPVAAHGERGAQVALIASLMHERFTDPRVGAWLDALDPTALDEVQRAGARNHRRNFDRARKVSADLSGRQALAAAAGYASWHRARQERDFAIFQPALQRNLDLAREEAAAIDPGRHPYDVLLEKYDPGTTLADLRSELGRLRVGLVELIRAVAARDPIAIVDDAVPIELQRELHRRVTDAMGYERSRGRIDDAVHPFTVRLGSDDVRITTHFHERDLLGGLGGTMHEAGHALYELGMPSEVGSGVDGAASLGVHESQSRFWENYIGRSRPFLGWVADRLEEIAPGTGIDGERLFRAANRIAPSLIRIYADEVTYNLHVIVRYELEVALVEGSLAVADLPGAWNRAYAETLGVTPGDDVEGVLQDVHWSGGSFGYFPSYTLGNLYAAALGRRVGEELPGLWDQVGRGELGWVLAWLRERIHRHGHRLDGAPLIREAVGDVDLVEGLLDYLWGRHGAAYGVTRPRA